MIKHLLSTAVIGITAISSLNAQVENVSQFASQAENIAVNINPRQAIDLITQQDLTAYSWTREVYRDLNDTENRNTALFNPKVSNEEYVNLFSFIFNLAKQHKVPTYRYGISVVGEPALVDFKDVLSMYGMPYTEKADGTLDVDMQNLQRVQVISYKVRETWYFDSQTNKGGIKPTAICPVVRTYDAAGRQFEIPLFWVLLDDMSLYLERAIGDMSSYPNLKGGWEERVPTLYDFLVKRLYTGEIYQVEHQVLAKTYTDPNELAQQKAILEQQHKCLEEHLKSYK